jgi:alcohol dehydrogenase (cytochrome c)
VRGKFTGGGYANIDRVTGNLSVVDPATGELKTRKSLPYPINSGVVTTGGGLAVTAMLDGTVLAFDDTTWEELWSINVGTGFSAPPMTYAVDGKQYIAIASGISGVGKAKLVRSPEMKTRNQATVLWVFGL